MEEPGFAPIPVIFVGSLIYMIAALDECSEADEWGGKYAWALSVGIISTAASGALVFLAGTGKASMFERQLKIIALFFFVWWALGAGIGTFVGPFKIAGNGYFAAWLTFLFALKLAYSTTPAFRAFTDRAVSSLKEQEQSYIDADANAGPANPAEGYA